MDSKWLRRKAAKKSAQCQLKDKSKIKNLLWVIPMYSSLRRNLCLSDSIRTSSQWQNFQVPQNPLYNKGYPEIGKFKWIHLIEKMNFSSITEKDMLHKISPSDIIKLNDYFFKKIKVLLHTSHRYVKPEGFILPLTKVRLIEWTSMMVNYSVSYTMLYGFQRLRY